MVNQDHFLCVIFENFSCQKGKKFDFCSQKLIKTLRKWPKMSANVRKSARNVSFWEWFLLKNWCFRKNLEFSFQSGQFWESHCTTVFKSCYNITTFKHFENQNLSILHHFREPLDQVYFRKKMIFLLRKLTRIRNELKVSLITKSIQNKHIFALKMLTKYFFSQEMMRK